MAWFILKWSLEENLTSIPEKLKIGCMSARPNKDKKVVQVRKPNYENYEFPSAYNNIKHANSNIKANWLISEALKQNKNGYFSKKTLCNPHRALEAALFMWGYDLRYIMPNVRVT